MIYKTKQIIKNRDQWIPWGSGYSHCTESSFLWVVLFWVVQLPTNFHNLSIVKGVWAPGVGSFGTIYGMQCASNHPVSLSERPGYLWCTFACVPYCRVHWRVGRRLGMCRLISVKPLSTAVLCGYWRFCLLYIDTVSIKSITACYGGWLS